MLFCSKRVRRKFTWRTLLMNYSWFQSLYNLRKVLFAMLEYLLFVLQYPFLFSSKTLHSSFASCSSCSLLLIFERTLVSCSWSGSINSLINLLRTYSMTLSLLLNAWFKYGSGLNSRLIELMSSEYFFYCTVAL